jgi:tetratricopeptide (TPR) repeat protein
MDPEFYLARWYLGRVLIQQNRIEEAISVFERAVDLSGEDPFQVSALAHAQAVGGNREEATRLLGVLEAGSENQYVSPYGIAEVYVALGDFDKAFHWLERAYEERSVYLIYLPVEPRLDPVRSDPRFEDFLERMGF